MESKIKRTADGPGTCGEAYQAQSRMLSAVYQARFRVPSLASLEDRLIFVATRIETVRPAHWCVPELCIRTGRTLWVVASG